ncbi:MAG: hypothetical protein NHG36_20085 [Chromatiaceae bacterium]|nr:hypothetical protein [Candidatus Thioaporhodococcus sediminis]
MAITVDTLKFFQSERMTDNTDGGGQMTDTEIVSGADNQIFDDVSDVDRAAGDVSIRKIYAAVTSADTDKYLDAGVVIFQEPADPAASVLAFSTGSYYDERAALKSRIEQTIVRGARWNGWLWGSHLTGQRAVVLWQRPENEVPPVGQRLELVARASSVEQYSQFLWITRVTETLRNQYDDKGVYSVREVVCEIAEALEEDYTGLEPSRIDPIIGAGTSLVYDTRYNAEAVALFGIRPMVAEATTLDFSVQVDSLYEYIIPTALSETALADVNPGGDSPALIAGNSGTISFTTTTQTIKPDVALYLGTGAKPGTISIAVSGATLTDDNGVMRLSGSDIGAIDYGNGIITWNSSCPNYSTASKVVTYTPAARPLRVADSAALAVTTENRGFVWTTTLTPIPAPQTLRISYRVNNKWYVLTDQGNGLLRGTDSAYGSGTLNFSTGTVMITTGALPDVDSIILLIWGTPIDYTARGGSAVDAPVVRGQTAQVGLRAGYVSVSWTVGVTTYTLDDSPAADGALTGTGGVGAVDYETGEWWVRPTTLPATGTEFTISYDYGTASSASELITDVVEPVVSGGGTVYTCTLANTDIAAGTLTANYRGNFENDTVFGLEVLSKALTDRDDGAGAFINAGGTINYSAGTVVFNPHVATDFQVKTYEAVPFVYRQGSHWVGNGWESKSLTSTALNPTAITFRYRLSGAADWSSDSETVVFSQLTLDLTRGFQEAITRGSVRFRLGTDVYVDTAGQIYRNPSPETGAGTLAGTLDPITGRCYITIWTAGITNAVTLDSLVTELGGHPVGQVLFRTPIAPIRSGTLQLRYTTAFGDVESKTVDGTGLLEDTDCSIQVDYPLGIVKAQFGLWKVDGDLTPEEKLEDWYDPDLVVDIGGVDKIWKPIMVMADSILYNAVAQTVLPPDSTLLGINAARLPPDGKGLIFNTGRLVLVHHTDTHSENSLSPTQDVDMGRVRLYRVVIDDDDDKRLPASFYSVNRETGIVTMAADLDLTGYSGPYTFRHTVADLARLVSVDINGTLTLNKALSHTYPADDSRVSGVLYVGTLQARYSNLFSQSAWTSVWSDARIGDAPLAQYNDVTYPPTVSNLGAYQDRFVLRFTSSTAFGCYGENLGYLGAGNINENFAPVNSLTGQPYFTLDYRGWGGGWATGNCLRFNLVAACYPVDVVRAIQPSSPTGLDDAVEMLFIGNVDA